MKKIFLTSAGFHNKIVEQKFLELAQKPAADIKALWIPTAAVNDDAKAMLPVCMNDLLNAGVLPSNITIYDLDYSMDYEEIIRYDVVYVCGGDSRYLLTRMYEARFVEILKNFLHQGGIYIGVSAGSLICVNGFEDNLGSLPCTLNVHCSESNVSGTTDISQCTHINLTDMQAIILEDEKCYILE